MRRIVLAVITVLLTGITAVMAQDNISAAEKEIAYRKVVFERAGKIVKGMNIADSAKALNVTSIIAKQYQDLNNIYTFRDNRKTVIKAETANNKEAAAAQLKAVEDETNAKIDKLHPQFLTRLSKAGLTPEQVNQVKDGLTYNVLNVTMNAYNAMLPNLTAEQKAQILAWLTEAREHSMDAESSEKKHAWFGKYKGRINNYLSAAGIDMKKEEAAWLARVKEEKQNKQNNK